MSSKSKVYFFFDNVSPNLRSRNKIRSAVEYLFKKEGKSLASLNYVFCSDEKILSINRNYLSHDFYTDIITFDLSDGHEIIGEIYISADRVKENAKQLKVSLFSEQLRVIFHGALHLCGYKDKSKAQVTLMHKKENHYLKRFS